MTGAPEFGHNPGEPVTEKPAEPRTRARPRDGAKHDPPWVADFFGAQAASGASKDDALEVEPSVAPEDVGEDIKENVEEDIQADATRRDELAAAEIPDRPRDDELLVTPPFGDHHLGRLGGYRSGVRQRRRLSIALGVALVGSMIAGFYYLRYLEQYRAYDVFELPPDAELEGRPRVMTWSDGKARFGLHRAPPGVHTIELPDRTVRLADGCERAQIRVNIVDGKTVELTVITGDVTETPRASAGP
ncbi:MAG: hypothetical protein H6713_10615 [Myxococcales bacterium]|nr:hypothetical protein [Myxococcales bacterium]MCB9750429.1 hypothetical protein [Myxococcales bacterium]